jgi:hypothetical protein
MEEEGTLKEEGTKAAPPPDADQGNNETEKGNEKLYTQEEVEKKLRGQGKALAEAKAQLAKIEADREAAERKRLEEKGEHKQLADRAIAAAEAKERAAIAEAEARQAAEDKLAALTARMEASYKKRIAALPVTERALAKLLPFDALEDGLPLLEKQAHSKTVNVHGGAGRGGGEPVDAVKRATKIGNDWIHGNKNGGAK